MRRLFVLAALLLAVPAHALVEIDWVTVGDPGNPADTEVMSDGTTGYGSVDYVYRISKYEVTNVTRQSDVDHQRGAQSQV